MRKLRQVCGWVWSAAERTDAFGGAVNNSNGIKVKRNGAERNGTEGERRAEEGVAIRRARRRQSKANKTVEI